MITPIYAALLALIFLALSVRTIRLRQQLGIAIGDQGDDAMQRAMRVHANFAEYAPLTLLLLFMLEPQVDSPLLMHGLGAALLVGRFLHAAGVSSPAEDLRWRVIGMVLTFTALGTAALGLLYTGFTAS